MDLLSVEDLSCPVCCEIFIFPVILSCGHNVCKACLQNFWKTKNTQECPVCRRRSSRNEPPCNLVLKNACESFTEKRSQISSSGSEEVCSLHNEHLKLFCLEDKQPVCLVCKDSEKHANHQFRTISEIVSSYKDQLNRALKSLQEKIEHTERNKEECDKEVLHIKTQAEHTEQQIKEEFKKLHQFLQDEEEASITALRKEEEKKSQMMKEMNRQISALSDIIKDIEEKMNTSNVSFLHNFNATVERAQSSQQDPQMLPGALIDVADHLRNLTFRVWKKMQKLVQNTPVTLDPNTAHSYLILSDNLTSLTYSKTLQLVPDNPERFEKYSCVLGSEGFNSGTHFWDVEVADNSFWAIGVTTDSNQRKETGFFNNNVWCVWYKDDEYFSQSPEIPNNPFSVKEKLQRVRLELDWDRGKLSFCHPVTNTHLCTITSTFTDRVFPLFYSRDINSSLRTLPAKVVVTTEKH